MIFLDDIDWYKNMVESKRKIVNKTEANKLSQICFTTPCILQCLYEVQMHTPSINFLDASVFPLNSILRAKQIKFKHHCCVDCWAPIHIKTPQCSSVCPFSLFMRGALLQYLTDPLETGFNIYNCTDVIMVFISILYVFASGHTISLDICSLWSDNKHIRFTFSLAYGFLGDVLKTSEQHRWMGPKRYKWGAVRRLWKLR